jgi:uncharacterized protein (DUF3820 family)
VFIQLTIYVSFLLDCTVPVLIIVSEDPGASVFVRTVIVWMNDLAVVTLIFGNLMHSVHVSSKAKNSRPEEEKTKLGVAIRQYLSSSARNNQHPKIPRDVVSHDVGGGEQVHTIPEEMISDNDLTATTQLPSSQNVRRPPCISSSISMTSVSPTSRNVPSTRFVSFNESATISEIPSIHSEREEQRTQGSERRFSTETLEAAPLKPSRFPHDAVMVQPTRQPWYWKQENKDGEIPSPLNDSPHGRHSMESSRQRLEGGDSLIKPLRQPSEVELPLGLEGGDSPIKPLRQPSEVELPLGLEGGDSLIKPLRQPSEVELSLGLEGGDSLIKPLRQPSKVELPLGLEGGDSLIKPLRQPSEVELPLEIDISGHSFETKSENHGKRNDSEHQQASSESATKVPHAFHGPPQLPSRGVSIFEITQQELEDRGADKDGEGPLQKPSTEFSNTSKSDQASQHQCPGGGFRGKIQ